MNIEKYKQTLKKAGLVLSLGLGAVLLSGVDASAQRRNDDDKRERKAEKRERKEEKRERKAERREEREEIRDDRRNDRDDRREDRDDRDGREDRRERREDREELRDTYNGYGNNVYRQAQENGYREGLQLGQDDARSGRRPNPQGYNQYKRGTSGYSNRYGNKDAYRDAFAAPFCRAISRAFAAATTIIGGAASKRSFVSTCQSIKEKTGFNRAVFSFARFDRRQEFSLTFRQKKVWSCGDSDVEYQHIKSGGTSIMNCWHCSNQLEFNREAAGASKFYHCEACDKWYEMKKDRERVNGAVPVRFTEIDGSPDL